MKTYNRLISSIALSIWITFLMPCFLSGQANWSQLSNIPVNFQSESAQLKVINSEFTLGALEAASYYPYDNKLKLIQLSTSGGAHSLQEYQNPSNSYWQRLTTLGDFLMKPPNKFILGGIQASGSPTIGELIYPDSDIHNSNDFTTEDFAQTVDGSSVQLRDLSITHIAQGAGKYVLSLGLPTHNSNYSYSERTGGLFYSDDADRWSPVALPLQIEIKDLSFQNDLFVACGRFSEEPYYYYPYAEHGDGVVLFSSDGINWTIQLISTAGALNALVWNETNWITVGENGVIWKWEGIVWNEVVSPTEKDIERVTYANGHLIVGTEDGDLYSTKDQATWAHQARLQSDLINIVANETHFAALSDAGVWLSEFSVIGTADIISHPEDTFTVPGAQVTLQVHAIGDSTLSYQWYEGASGNTDSPIAGATSATFTTPVLLETKEYWVQVSNSIGTDNSFTARLRMQTQPRITDQPDSELVEIGRSHFMRVKATGENLSYQWFYGISGDTSLPVHGEVGSSMTVRPGFELDTHYWVRVSNGIGFTDSSTARITGVLVAPKITTQPRDRSYFAGATSLISVSTEGYGLTYDWYRGQSGDTSNLVQSSNWSSYTVHETTPGVYEYWMRVSNAAGSVDSRTVQYEILQGQAPVITKSPLSVSVFVGESTRLSVTSYGHNRQYYQWYAGESGDTSLPLNETGSSFEPATLFIGTTPYWVRVYDDYGHADSETTYVTVVNTGFAAIKKQPLNFSAYRNSQTSHSTFVVLMAAPEDVVSYQWYAGASGDTTMPIADATNSSYTPDLAVIGVFSYWVRIVTTTGTVDSEAAFATIVATPFTIRQQPNNFSKFVNGYAFSSSPQVEATGENLSYQWYEGISGDTSLPLVDQTASTLQSPFDTVGKKEYWVRVSSDAGMLNSRTVTYSILESSPGISRQPEDLEMATSENGRIYVSVSGSSSDFTYQWYKGRAGDTSSPVPDETDYDLNIQGHSMGVYRYWVRVFDANDHVDSESATVIIHPADYLSWATAYGIAASPSTSSTANDGVSNLMKYAMGLPPTQTFSGDILTRQVRNIGNQDYFTLQFQLRSDLSDVAVYIEATNDLSDGSSWRTTPVDMGPTIDNGDGTLTYTYRSRNPISSESQFFKLVIEETP